MRLDAFVEHPHDRGVLTYYEVTCLFRDWERAGRPEGQKELVDFLASTWPWKDMEVWWITNTFAEWELTRNLRN